MIYNIPETKSTNQYAQDLLVREQVSDESIVITHCQTAGKGQMGNSWEAEPGKNLTFSVVLFPQLDVRKQFALSEVVSLALIDVLSAFTDGFSVKWPNDIYYHEKKIAGILIENNLSGHNIDSCVVGIGLNVNQSLFRSDAPNPVSLTQITGKTYDLEKLLGKISEALHARYAQLHSAMEATHTEYKKHLFRVEGLHPYRDAEGLFHASIAEVASDGHLFLQKQSGDILKYAFKEVEFVL